MHFLQIKRGRFEGAAVASIAALGYMKEVHSTKGNSCQIDSIGVSMSAVKLRHIKRIERPYVQRNQTWIALALLSPILLWLVVLGQDIMRHSTSPHPFAFASRQMLEIAIALPLLVYGGIQSYKLSIRLERRYLLISSDAIVVLEKPALSATTDREISRWRRVDIGIVRSQPMGQRSAFIFESKNESWWNTLLGRLGTRSRGRMLIAEEWVADDNISRPFERDAFWSIKLTTRKEQIEKMKHSDLGKALIANGYLT